MRSRLTISALVLALVLVSIPTSHAKEFHAEHDLVSTSLDSHVQVLAFEAQDLSAFPAFSQAGEPLDLGIAIVCPSTLRENTLAELAADLPDRLELCTAYLFNDRSAFRDALAALGVRPQGKAPVPYQPRA